MIKNIIFDFGSCLIDFNDDALLEKAGVSNEEDRTLLKREVIANKEWIRADRGLIDEEQLYQGVIERIPERLWDAAHALVFDWENYFEIVDGMLEFVEEMSSKGYHLFLLSNASKRLRTQCWPNYPYSKYIKDLVISAEIKMLKPHYEIFNYLLDKYELNADECVFIDDVTLNVEASEYLGMHGIVFHQDAEELRNRFNEIINEK